MQEAQLKLDEMMNLLEPYLVSLTPAERRTLIKMGNDNFAFLELSYGLAVEYPDLFPSFMKAAVFKEEFFAAQGLWTIFNRINLLRDRISDTEMLAGNIALETAMAFYHTVKMAARRDIPGARIIFDELRPVFSSGRQKRRKAG